MRWLTALLALLLVALVALPTTVDALSAMFARPSGNVQSINYLSREIHEWSASRRRAVHRRGREVAPAELPRDQEVAPAD
jgi:hypothetical protein